MSEPRRKSDKWTLLEDPKVRAWMDDVESARGGSDNTRSGYLRALRLYIEFLGKTERSKTWTPSKIIEDAEKRPKRHKELINAFIVSLWKRKLASSSVKSRQTAIRSFYRSHDIAFKLKRIDVSYERARVLDKDEVRRLFEAARRNRDQALVLLFATTGVRPGSISKLKIKHLEDLDSKTFLPTRLPVLVRAWDDKKDRFYPTFTNEQTIDALRRYFRERELGEEEGPPEALGPESPVIRTYWARKDKKTGKIVRRHKGMSKDNVELILKRLVRLAEVNPTRVSPTSFRRFHAQALDNAGCLRTVVDQLQGRKAAPGASEGYHEKEEEALRQAYAASAPEAFDFGKTAGARMESLEKQVDFLRESFDRMVFIRSVESAADGKIMEGPVTYVPGQRVFKPPYEERFQALMRKLYPKRSKPGP